MPDQETEITLGTGRLAGLFFGLVALCAVFFVMGYLLGKNKAPGNTLLADTPPATAMTQEPPRTVAQQEPSAPAEPVQEPPQTTEQPPETTAATPAPAPERAPVRHETRRSAAPEVARPAPVAPSGYLVQVAAVSKQQDAKALVSALKKKHYAVFIADHTGDNLYHVQIGPFNDQKQAEGVRSRLVADGYSPILKK